MIEICRGVRGRYHSTVTFQGTAKDCPICELLDERDELTEKLKRYESLLSRAAHDIQLKEGEE